MNGPPNQVLERTDSADRDRERLTALRAPRPELESWHLGASEGLSDLRLDPFSTRVNGKDDVVGAPVLPGRRHLQMAGEVNRLTGP